MPIRKFKATATTAATAAIAAEAVESEVLQGTDNHTLSFPDKTWEVIDKLASANTGGNRSRLLAMLAHQAAMIPDAFGLKPATGENGEGQTEAAQA